MDKTCQKDIFKDLLTPSPLLLYLSPLVPFTFHLSSFPSVSLIHAFFFLAFGQAKYDERNQTIFVSLPVVLNRVKEESLGFICCCCCSWKGF